MYEFFYWHWPLSIPAIRFTNCNNYNNLQDIRKETVTTARRKEDEIELIRK